MRDLKYILKITVKNSLLLAAMLGAFTAIFTVLGSSSMRRGIGSTMLLYCIILGVANTFSLCTHYLRMSLTMGGTRKNFFIAAQAAKVISSAISVAFMFPCQFLLDNLSGSAMPMQMISAQNILPMMLGLIAISSVIEVMGLSSVRFGKAGVIIFVILICAIFGAGGGVMMVMSVHTGGGTVILDLVAFMAGNSLFMLISVGITIAFTAVSGLVMRKITVGG